MARPAGLGLWSGLGLVVANMVGAGVFLSTGFMAQDLGPWSILGAWVVGGVLALAGARAYAELALFVPRSGGEFRILSDLLHPAVGYLAGWTSLLIGFAGPIAVDAIAAGSFFHTLVPACPPRAFGLLVVLGITAVHAFNIRVSTRAQNGLVALKVVLVVGFALAGLAFGRNEIPTWAPPGGGGDFTLAPFMSSLFYVGFAFSGWNAAIYASGEFTNPQRDVPRAMLIGCGTVAVLYLAVNWVFVSNLDPQRAKVVFSFEEQRVTLGHVLANQALGALGGKIFSGLMLIALCSAMSAMIFVGPRVYASMAAEGFLPRALAPVEGRPPVGSVLLQGVFAIILMFAERIQNLLQSVSAILMIFSTLTAACLFGLWFRRGNDQPRPRATSLLAAAVFIASSVWMLYFGFRSSSHLLIWLALVFGIALLAYLFSRRRRR